MFTGIIEEIGKIEGITRHGKALRLTIRGEKIFTDMEIGCSIAVNGVCLTVTSFQGRTFTADVMPESIKMTTLAKAGSGTPVNLERAMAANGRFGGHMVAGHVDGTGTVIKRTAFDNSVVFRIQVASEIMDYVIYKGSVAVDGTSLTVSAVGDDYFEISIIPHTLGETILSKAQLGTVVNIETDIVGRYMRHFMERGSFQAKSTGEKTSASPSTDNFTALLVKNGFI